jgi:hypothetical protein
MEQPNGKDYGTEVIVSSGSGSELFEKSEDNLPTAPEVAYPSGIRLALIITALCLAVFLTSLDMVCIPLPKIPPLGNNIQPKAYTPMDYSYFSLSFCFIL